MRKLVLIPSTTDLPAGLSPADWQSNIAAAADSWNAVLSTCSDLRLDVGAPTQEWLARDDGQTILVFRTRSWCHNERCGPLTTYPLGAMAMTSTYPERATGGQVRGADVEFNGRALRLHAGQWNFFTPDGRGAISLEAVIRHELGHVLGLPDPCEADRASGGTERFKACLRAAPESVMLGANRITAGDTAQVCRLHARPSGCAFGNGSEGTLAPTMVLGVVLMRRWAQTRRSLRRQSE